MKLHPDTRYRNPNFQRGSILVICMVMAALGTIGVTAWVSLIQARGGIAEANFAAIQRRVFESNSKALAYHAIYKNHLLSTTGLAVEKIYTLPFSLGRAKISPYAMAPLAENVITRTANSGVMPIHTHSTDTVVELGTATNPERWTFQMRSQNPILGGDLLSFHPPTVPNYGSPIVSGSLKVKGRASFWDAGYKDFQGGIRADEFLLPNDIVKPTTFSDVADNATLPLNYPFPRQATGLAGGSPAYLGELDIVQSSTNTANNQFDRIRATGNYQEVDGFVSFSYGSSVATVLPGSNDSVLKTQITSSGASSPPTATLGDALIAASPLSSDVMIHALNTPNAFPATDLINVLNANSPLPNDVLTRLADASVNSPSPLEKDLLYAAANVWVVSDGNGKVTVNLDVAALQNVIIISASSLVLKGPDTATAANALASQPARAIALANPNSATLPNVSLQLINQNRRKIVLSIATELAATGGVNFPMPVKVTGSAPFPVWNMVMDLQNTLAEVNVSAVSAVRIVGGIRLDSPIKIIGGDLILDRELAADDYGDLVSRNAWVESFRN